MHIRHRAGLRGPNMVLTLGDAVAAVSAVTTDEREVVPVVLHMLRRRSIRLIGAARFNRDQPPRGTEAGT